MILRTRKSWYLGINKTIYCIPIEIRNELFDLISWEAVHTMLLLTNCEVHTGKYLDRSIEVWGPYEKLKSKYFPVWTELIGQ